MLSEAPLVLTMDVFPCIAWFQKLVSSNHSMVQIDTTSKWQKQTARTRYEIAGPNKRLQLVIPVQKSSRNQWGDVVISYEENWPLLHWRSMESAYNRSPYFEYYKDELEQMFKNPGTSLMDWNSLSIKWLCEKLQLDIEVIRSMNIAESGAYNSTLPRYNQVFEHRTGFLPNLSMLDLLFNLGPEAITRIR